MRKGKFIVIEGADGLGKSSVIREMKKLNMVKIFNNGLPVYFLNDPSSNIFIAKDIRNILKENSNKMCKETNLLLMLAARRELTKEIEHILEYSNVICDRYSLSTHVYQGMNIPSSTIERLSQELSLEIKPDITFVLTRKEPYRKEINDTIEQVFPFELIEERYEKACKSCFRQMYNIIELPLSNKTMNERLEFILEMIQRV